jgi:transcriptional regulator with XRE-family HTH domain
MKTEFDKYIIDRVRTIRKDLRCTQRGIAEILGRSPAFVGQVESNNSKYPHKYSMYHLFLIAKDFDKPIDDFFPPRDWEPPLPDEYSSPAIKIKK